MGLVRCWQWWLPNRPPRPAPWSCRKALAWRKACLAAPQSLPFAMPAAFVMTLASQAFRSAEDAATVKESGLNSAALRT